MKLFNMFLVFLIVFCVASFAGVIEIPEGDPLIALLNMIQNFKTMSPLMLAATIIVLVVQGVKRFAPGFKYLKVVAVVAGVVYATIQSMISGMNLIDSAVFVLLTSGGAVALYEVFKNPINSVTGVK